MEGRPAHALGPLRHDRWQPFAGVRAVFVDGFTDFTAAQIQALVLLARRIEELRIALPDEPGDQRAELSAGPGPPASTCRRNWPLR